MENCKGECLSGSRIVQPYTVNQAKNFDQHSQGKDVTTAIFFTKLPVGIIRGAFVKRLSSFFPFRSSSSSSRFPLSLTLRLHRCVPLMSLASKLNPVSPLVCGRSVSIGS